jgi:hypothetical protein
MEDETAQTDATLQTLYTQIGKRQCKVFLSYTSVTDGLFFHIETLMMETEDIQNVGF